jgi:dihydrolipoamide dehydrogenase
VKQIDASVDATVTVMKTGEEVTYHSAYLFQSLARIPNSLTLGLERIGVTLAEDGTIPVDAYGQTNQPHIYAIGEVNPGPHFATRAIHEAKRTAAHLSGQDVDPTTPYYPTVLRTFPPIASVGLTEQEAREAGHTVKSGQFPLNAKGTTTIEGGSGFVKVIADEQTSLILGIHMRGDDAHRLVGQFTQALELTAKREDLLFPVMAHPSRSEALTESILEAIFSQSIHLPPRQQIGSRA